MKSSRRTHLSQVDRDVFGLEVLLDALGASFPAKAGVLDPAEGRRGVRDYALVEAHHAGLQAFADPERALEIAGVDVGDEAVLGGVGGPYGLLLGAEGE